MGGWGGVCKVIFVSNPTVVLRLGWGFDTKLTLRLIFGDSKHFYTLFFPIKGGGGGSRLLMENFILSFFLFLLLKPSFSLVSPSSSAI